MRIPLILQFTLVLPLSLTLAVPSYSRGFSRGGGGSSRDFGSFHGSESARFGGGFNNISREGAGNMAGHSDFANRMPTDGGFGNMAENRHPTQINQTNLSSQGNNVRGSFNNDTVNRVGVGAYGHHYGYGAYGGYHYGYGAWGGYPSAWGSMDAAMWTCVGMSSLTSFLGMAAIADSSSNSKKQPASSSSVVYEGDNVYINGQSAASAQDYYKQAQNLALIGQATGSQVNLNKLPEAVAAIPNETQIWQPLGVFSLAEPGQNQSNMLLQLQINKDGVVQGKYFNQLTNESSQVYGSLDKKTQRVSWTIGTNPKTVFDAQLADLVKDDSSVLVHYGPSDTARMALIRLPKPQTKAQG